MRYLFVILFLLISTNLQSQIFEKNLKLENQYFNYNQDVLFVIKKMREEKRGGFGYSPLRGYTSYVMYLLFQNRSKDSIYEVDLKKIHLANPRTKKKFDLKWYNVAGVGSKTKSTFRIKPGKKRTFILFYMYEKNEDIFFLIDEKLSKIKLLDN
ncbi:hypothetical protein [Flagellimonas sp.]|uniref:hypothetical protein n=1 Tax=Flagellimonas sp. TaxID=2058762 RepID=UPI003F4A146D